MKTGQSTNKLFTPLHILAERHELGEVQLMDKETLEWIKSVSNYRPLVQNLAKITFNNEDFTTLEDLLPKNDEFLRQDHIASLHGIGHIARTMVNVIAICKKIGIQDYKLYLFMMRIHDLRRQNDQGDTGHGRRAWEWFAKNKNKYDYAFLNNQDYLEELETAVTYHETNYEDIPADILSKHKHIIDIVKAADALDRYRMPKAKWFPSPQFIDLVEAHSLLPLAQRLTIESEEKVLNGEDIRLAVINTAKSIYS